MDQRHGREVGCTDVMERTRVARVFRLDNGKLGIQPPPGEWFEVTALEFQQLMSTGRDALRDRQFASVAALCPSEAKSA